MSNTLRWILTASIFVALLIMLIAWLWMKSRIKKVKNEYLVKNKKYVDDKKIANIAARTDHGILLWNLKEKTKNPLDDLQLEYIINTIMRNEYKTTRVVNEDKYIQTSLQKIAKQRITRINPDTIIMENSENLNSEFDVIYKEVKKGGLIFITNAHGREIKKLLAYTKLVGIRREYDKKIGKGIITIAK